MQHLHNAWIEWRDVLAGAPAPAMAWALVIVVGGTMGLLLAAAKTAIAR